MSEMIEKVQKTVHSYLASTKCVCGCSYDTAEVAFKASIEALMEPTDKMKFAGAHLKGVAAANRMIKPTSTETYKAMLSAAMKE